MRVALYTRVSTAQQSDEMQRRELRAFAQARGWAIAAEFSDVGWSGAKERRPGLDGLMAAARKRQLDAVLVWRFDRFARSTRHLLLALEEFRALGVGFISYQESVDTGSPLGEAMFTIISAIAQLERSLIRERINAGLAHAKAKGVRVGRPRRRVDVELARMLRAEGRGLRETARLMGVARGTLYRALRADAQAPGAARPARGATGAAQNPSAAGAALAPKTPASGPGDSAAQNH
jgi:DNA invertase Pin-like site-specific DNA recombinase